MSDIIDFYRDEGQGANRTFEQIMVLDDIALEYAHDWVQWAFPLPEPSRAQPSSPVMVEADIEAFKTDELMRANVARMFDRWMLFLENTSEWLRPYDHNHLRTTRTIRFLTLINMPNRARKLYEFCWSRHERLPDKTAWFWREALEEHPAWLK